MDDQEIINRLIRIRSIVKDSWYKYNYNGDTYIDGIGEEIDQFIADLTGEDNFPFDEDETPWEYPVFDE